MSRWETGTGEPELSLLAALAEYFQVSVDQLLGLTPMEGETVCFRRPGNSPFAHWYFTVYILPIYGLLRRQV